MSAVPLATRETGQERASGRDLERLIYMRCVTLVPPGIRLTVTSYPGGYTVTVDNGEAHPLKPDAERARLAAYAVASECLIQEACAPTSPSQTVVHVDSRSGGVWAVIVATGR